jgi:integrase
VECLRLIFTPIGVEDDEETHDDEGAEQVVKDIRRATRKLHSSEEKIWIVLSDKGKSGRIVPLNKQLRSNLGQMLSEARQDNHFGPETAYVLTTERSGHTSAQAVVNMFKRRYASLGLLGCSSHSGRRTFITNAAKKISTVGGSLRDVQMLAGHSSLAVTQRYIESDSQAQRRIVDM